MALLQRLWQDAIVRQIIISAVTALITALITTTFYRRKIAADLRKEYASRLHEQRWKVYREFIERYGGGCVIGW